MNNYKPLQDRVATEERKVRDDAESRAAYDRWYDDPRRDRTIDPTWTRVSTHATTRQPPRFSIDTAMTVLTEAVTYAALDVAELLCQQGRDNVWRLNRNRQLMATAARSECETTLIDAWAEIIYDLGRDVVCRYLDAAADSVQQLVHLAKTGKADHNHVKQALTLLAGVKRQQRRDKWQH